jgi:uncharacterized integral membrane protein
MRSFIKIIQVICIVCIVASFSIFAFYNSESIKIRFMQYQSTEQPLFLIILGSFVLGVLLAGFLSLAEIVRLNTRLRRQDKSNRALEKQLHLIKQQPLMEDFQTLQQSLTNKTNNKTVAAQLDEEDESLAQETVYPHLR